MASDPLQGSIILYSIIGCPQCVKARKLLSRTNLPFTEVSIDSFPQCYDEIERRAGGNAMLPLIFFNDLAICGAEQLESLMNNTKEWESMIEVMRTTECVDGPPLPSPDTAVNMTEYDVGDNSNQDDALLWIPDEYSRLVNDMKKANLIKDNKAGLLRTYRNSFKGEDFVEWIMRDRGIKRKEALEIGQELIDRHFGQQTSKETGMTFSPDRYYQLVEDDENKPLNCGNPSDESLISVADYNDTLVKLIKCVYDDILTDQNRTIRYHRLVDNDNFNRYLQYCKDLQRVNMIDSTPDERLALLVNVYNMMLIHMTQKYGPPQSVWQRRKFMNSTYYQIQGHKYALQSILNGILRSNKKGVGMLWKPFGKQDKRLPLILPECQPLVHFALTTGTRSTPSIRVYTCKTVLHEMRENAKEVLRSDDCLRVDSKKNTLYLTKIFKWYADDFGGSTEKIIEWILDLFEGEESEKYKSIQKMYYTGEYNIDYLPYDWTFNGKEKKEQRLTPAIDIRMSDQIIKTPIIDIDGDDDDGEEHHEQIVI